MTRPRRIREHSCVVCGAMWCLLSGARGPQRLCGITCKAELARRNPPPPGLGGRRRSQCTVCGKPARARGLCSKHYARRQAGITVEDVPPTPDQHGYGTYGTLTVVPGGRVICHECGGEYHHLGSHVAKAHDMTTRAYKIAHGLPIKVGLLAPQTRARLRAFGESHMADPVVRATAVARLATAESAPADPVARVRSARHRSTPDQTLTAEQQAALTTPDPDAWAEAARDLIAARFTLTTIAAAAGVSPMTVSRRLRRIEDSDTPKS